MEDDVESRPRWRGWHVIARFIPMLFLAFIFLIIGAANLAPHNSRESFSPLFLWIGAILLVGSILGMIFTKCPDCTRARWIVCAQEPDVVRRPRQGHYHRELSPIEDEG
jgi:hypothetical protein